MGIDKITNDNPSVMPIRVLHATPRMQREGIQSFLMNLYHNIDRQKVQFDFLVHSKQEGAFDAEIEEMGGRIYRVHQMASPHFLHYNRDVEKVLKAHPYKIIHSHINLLSSFTLKIAMAHGVLVRIAHSHSSSILDSGLKKFIKLYAKKQMLKYATHCFACSKDAGIWQFGKETWDSRKVDLIPNGIDIEKNLFSDEKRQAIRNKFNIDANTFVAGHVGAFRKVKNHSFLIKIFAEIKKLKPNSKLLLVGSGELEEEIRNELGSLGVLNDVIFAGSVENVCDYYSAMDAFVFPSAYEGLGIVLVEAQSSGLACFPSDVLPSEANLSKHYYPLSLQASPNNWAKFILAHSPNKERVCPPATHAFDINKITKTMENFYLNCFSKN